MQVSNEPHGRPATSAGRRAYQSPPSESADHHPPRKDKFLRLVREGSALQEQNWRKLATLQEEVDASYKRFSNEAMSSFMDIPMSEFTQQEIQMLLVHLEGICKLVRRVKTRFFSDFKFSVG